MKPRSDPRRLVLKRYKTLLEPSGNREDLSLPGLGNARINGTGDLHCAC
jgi:hypothetical protein